MTEPEVALPDAFLKALGIIVTNFSYLEYRLAGHCDNLINAKIPGTGVIITAEMSFNNLLTMISALFKNAFKNPEVQKELKEILARVDRCAKNRNEVVHSIWTPEFPFVKKVKGEVVRRVKHTAKRKKGLEFQWENYSLDDLHKSANEIRNLTEELQTFFESVFFSLGFASTSDAGKSYPMEIEQFEDENTGKTFYVPKLSKREKELTKRIEAYEKKLKTERDSIKD